MQSLQCPSSRAKMQLNKHIQYVWTSSMCDFGLMMSQKIVEMYRNRWNNTLSKSKKRITADTETTPKGTAATASRPLVEQAANFSKNNTRTKLNSLPTSSRVQTVLQWDLLVIKQPSNNFGMVSMKQLKPHSTPKPTRTRIILKRK